jgi:hypothetical protein
MFSLGAPCDQRERVDAPHVAEHVAGAWRPSPGGSDRIRHGAGPGGAAARNTARLIGHGGRIL